MNDKNTWARQNTSKARGKSPWKEIEHRQNGTLSNIFGRPNSNRHHKLENNSLQTKRNLVLLQTTKPSYHASTTTTRLSWGEIRPGTQRCGGRGPGTAQCAAAVGAGAKGVEVGSQQGIGGDFWFFWGGLLELFFIKGFEVGFRVFPLRFTFFNRY